MQRTYIFCDDCNPCQRPAGYIVVIEADVYKELLRISGGKLPTIVSGVYEGDECPACGQDVPTTGRKQVLRGVFEGTRDEARAEGWLQDDDQDQCAVCVALENVDAQALAETVQSEDANTTVLPHFLVKAITGTDLEGPSPFVGGWSEGPSAEAIAAANEKATAKRMQKEAKLVPAETPAPDDDGEERHA